ncbi:MAG: hypothetical protein JNN02_02035 [Tabrizicola sp.]|nr:hypothetical protein [Tabrizicola sp.]
MRRLAPLFVLAFAALASPAAADCAGDEEVFTCQIGAKSLEICHQGDDLTYAFGPKGAPDLTITESLTTVNFIPWPGVSSSIWETVAFQNAGYVYEVWTSVERDPEATEGRHGGIRVLQGEETVAELECDRDTPSSSLDGIFELKESVGLCWEFGSQSWKTACDNG